MNRYTFVIQIHPEGISTLENLSTQERIRVPDLAAVGAQIERWLESLPARATVATEEDADGSDGK
jgi:hypothetical protein